jgi:hypothetical protein
MAHGIFRSDSCSYTHDGALIRTAQVYGDIDNGAPILCGGLATTGTFAGEREVFTTSAATGANAADVWVVTSPEHAYTTDMKPLENFYNASGDIARISKLVKCDIFSITGEVCSGTPSTTDKYIAAGNGKWTASSASTKAFAQLLNTEVVGGKTMYVFEVL